MKKRICVIGAGAAGIGSVKSSIEAGYDVVCYEKTKYVGGLWRYHEEKVDGIASVMKSTIINSSKEMSSLSDFPVPANAPNYMHHTEMLRYLDAYADHFNVRPYINFEHIVTKIVKSADHALTGRWVITAESLVTGKNSVTTFDAVVICTGHHVKPLVPTFKGQEKFKGSIIHSHSYRDNKAYEGKNVVVVGVGNSGGDVAVEASFVASNTYLSTRRGCWVLKRTGDGGEPGDCQNLKRCWNWVVNCLPYNLVNYVFESDLNKNFNHESFGLKPSHRAMSQHPMVNDFMANRLITGSIKVRKNIREFTENGVIFEGDDEVTPVDAVVLCTGYSMWFPFLDQETLRYDGKGNMVDLYKFMFNPDLPHPETMAFVGLFQTIGAGFPAGELQIRWLMELLKGNVQLPPETEMREDIKQRREYRNVRFTDSERHEHQVDWINFMDDISSQFGAKPNLWKIFFTDILLWFYLVFGPCLPFQFRLHGPGANYERSRELILDYKYRVNAPLQRANQKLNSSAVAKPTEDLNNNVSKLEKFLEHENETNWRDIVNTRHRMRNTIH